MCVAKTTTIKYTRFHTYSCMLVYICLWGVKSTTMNTQDYSILVRMRWIVVVIGSLHRLFRVLGYLVDKTGCWVAWWTNTGGWVNWWSNTGYWVNWWMNTGCWVACWMNTGCWVNWWINSGDWVNWWMNTGCWVNWWMNTGCWVNCLMKQGVEAAVECKTLRVIRQSTGLL